MQFRAVILTVVIFCLISAPVFAQSDIGFKGIGLKVGYVTFESGGSWGVVPVMELGPTFTVGAVVDLGTFVPALHWDASVQYWRDSDVGLYGYNWSWSDIAIKSTVRYHFSTGWSVTPYAGGGVGIHMHSIEFESIDDSDTDFGFHAVGGVEFKLAQQWKAQVELEYAEPGRDQIGIIANFIYLLDK